MTKDLTRGTPWKVIVLYAIPILLGNLVQQLYNMADTVIVGNTLGLDALAAVGTTGSAMFFVLGFTMGLTSGFAVPIAQRFGAKDEKSMRHYVGLTIIWSAVIDIVMTAVGVSLCKPLLRLIDTPDNIFQDSFSYLVIIFAGSTFSMLYNMCAGILRAVGDSRTPLYFLIFSCCLNVGLDFLMIRGFHLGVAGAALATIFSQSVSGILCLILIKKRFPILHLSKEDFKMDWKMTRKMYGIGLPMALQFSITSVGQLVLQRTVNSFGSTVIGAQTAASKIQFLAELPHGAIGATMATFVAQNVGAGKYDRIRSGINSCLLIIFVSTILAFFMCRVPAPAIMRIFVSDISDEAMHYAMLYLRVMSWFVLFLGTLFLFRNTLQGAGLATVTLIGGIFEFVARIGVCMIANRVNVPIDTRYQIVCLAAPTAWVGTTIILATRYFKFLKEIREKAAHQKEEAGTEA